MTYVAQISWVDSSGTKHTGWINSTSKANAQNYVSQLSKSAKSVTLTQKSGVSVTKSTYSGGRQTSVSRNSFVPTHNVSGGIGFVDFNHLKANTSNEALAKDSSGTLHVVKTNKQKQITSVWNQNHWQSTKQSVGFVNFNNPKANTSNETLAKDQQGVLHVVQTNSSGDITSVWGKKGWLPVSSFSSRHTSPFDSGSRSFQPPLPSGTGSSSGHLQHISSPSPTSAHTIYGGLSWDGKRTFFNSRSLVTPPQPKAPPSILGNTTGEIQPMPKPKNDAQRFGLFLEHASENIQSRKPKSIWGKAKKLGEAALIGAGEGVLSVGNTIVDVPKMPKQIWNMGRKVVKHPVKTFENAGVSLGTGIQSVTKSPYSFSKFAGNYATQMLVGEGLWKAGTGVLANARVTFGKTYISPKSVYAEQVLKGKKIPSYSKSENIELAKKSYAFSPLEKGATTNKFVAKTPNPDYALVYSHANPQSLGKGELLLSHSKKSAQGLEDAGLYMTNAKETSGYFHRVSPSSYLGKPTLNPINVVKSKWNDLKSIWSPPEVDFVYAKGVDLAPTDKPFSVLNSEVYPNAPKGTAFVTRRSLLRQTSEHEVVAPIGHTLTDIGTAKAYTSWQGKPVRIRKWALDFEDTSGSSVSALSQTSKTIGKVKQIKSYSSGLSHPSYSSPIPVSSIFGTSKSSFFSSSTNFRKGSKIYSQNSGIVGIVPDIVSTSSKRKPLSFVSGSYTKSLFSSPLTIVPSSTPSKPKGSRSSSVGSSRSSVLSLIPSSSGSSASKGSSSIVSGRSSSSYKPSNNLFSFRSPSQKVPRSKTKRKKVKSKRTKYARDQWTNPIMKGKYALRKVL